MNGVAQFLLAGGVIVATAQLITGPFADWNARREGNEYLKQIAMKKNKQDEE